MAFLLVSHLALLRRGRERGGEIINILVLAVRGAC